MSKKKINGAIIDSFTVVLIVLLLSIVPGGIVLEHFGVFEAVVPKLLLAFVACTIVYPFLTLLETD